jgi:hypothetical protein
MSDEDRPLSDCHQVMLVVRGCRSCPFYWFDGIGNCNAINGFVYGDLKDPNYRSPNCPLSNDVVVVKLKEEK